MYGVLLILVLVVMGGAIAYIGDKLGTKVGKKKLSMFGLRPKHTSIIVTIITGILITSSTLGVLALASQNVRTALFGLEQLRAQISDTRQNLQEIAGQLAAANEEREKTVAALSKAQEDYRVASEDLIKSQEQIAALEQIKKGLEETKSRLEDEKNALEAAKAELNERVASLSDERDRLTVGVQKLNVITQRLAGMVDSFKTGTILYSVDEMITSGIVAYHEDENAIAEELAKLLQKANRQTLLRMGVKQETEAIYISRQDFAAAVDLIKSGRQEMIARIISAGNSVYGEPVRTRIELFPNKRIYREKEFILSEDYVLQRHDEAEAEQVVLNFLKRVNTEATEQGIMPDPLQGSVGVMNGAQFYDTVNQIESLEGTIRLSAYAANDTNAAGPLRLTIKIEQL